MKLRTAIATVSCITLLPTPGITDELSHLQFIDGKTNFQNHCAAYEDAKTRFVANANNLNIAEEAHAACVANSCEHNRREELRNRLLSAKEDAVIANAEMLFESSIWVEEAGTAATLVEPSLNFYMGRRHDLSFKDSSHWQALNSNFPTSVFFVTSAPEPYEYDTFGSGCLNCNQASFSFDPVFEELNITQFNNHSTHLKIVYEELRFGESYGRFVEANGAISFALQGRTGEVCDILRDQNGEIFSLDIVLPAPLEGAVSVKSTAKIVDQYYFEGENSKLPKRNFEEIFENLAADVLTSRIPSLEQIKKYHRNSDSCEIGSLNHLRAGIGVARSKLRNVGVAHWPTKEELFENASLSFTDYDGLYGFTGEYNHYQTEAANWADFPRYPSGQANKASLMEYVAIPESSEAVTFHLARRVDNWLLGDPSEVLKIVRIKVGDEVLFGCLE